MREEWREIEDYPDYEVSNLGQVRSYKANHKGFYREEPRIISFGKEGNYRSVVLCNDEGHREKLVHILVLEAFVGPCPEGEECRHLDGTKSNNDVRNLRWGTRLENAADSVRLGVLATGADQHSAVQLSKETVVEIQARYVEGESINSIANSFEDLSWNVVSKIVKGTHWSLRGD